MTPQKTAYEGYGKEIDWKLKYNARFKINR